MKLSALLVTYNHEKFIEQAVRSIFFQQLDEDWEIVVADDCSSDSTMDIIRKLEKVSPVSFRYLPNKKNLGICKNYERAFQSCTSEYVAVIEGDDYWTDPHRLQKHVKFLDEHHECSMSFNRYIVYNQCQADFHLQPWQIQDHSYEYITVKALANNNFVGNFSTCVYRKKTLDIVLPGLFDIQSYDWSTNMAVAQYGLIGYLGDIMSVYRLHDKGKWSSMSRLEQIEDMIKYINIYDAFFEKRLHDSFCQHIERLKNEAIGLRTAAIVKDPVEIAKPAVHRARDFIPPIIKLIIKLLIPEKIINYIVK